MKESQTHTDVVINMPGCPFLTLTESDKIPNIWVHKDFKHTFVLTEKGFIATKQKVNLNKVEFWRPLSS